MKRFIAVFTLLIVVFTSPASGESPSVGAGLMPGGSGTEGPADPAGGVSIGGGLAPGTAADTDDWYYDTAISLADETWDMATSPLYLRYHLLEVLDDMYAQVDSLAGMRKAAPGRAFTLAGVPRSALLASLGDMGIAGAALDRHIDLRMQDIRRTGLMAQEYAMQGISVYSESFTYFVMPDDFRPRLIMLDYGEAYVAVQFLERDNGVGMAAATLMVLSDGAALEDIMAEAAVPGLYGEPEEIPVY